MRPKLLLSLLLGAHAAILAPFTIEPVDARPRRINVRPPVDVQVIDLNRLPPKARVKLENNDFNRRNFDQRINFDQGRNFDQRRNYDQRRREFDADSGRGTYRSIFWF
jgi:hypothetical protein